MQGLFRGLSWLLFGSAFAIAAYKMATTGLVRTDPLTMVAMIGMALGMLCGGIATTAGVFEERRKRRRQMEEALGGGPADEQPAPDPNKPVKQYKARPLDAEKLKSEPTPPPQAPPPGPPPSA